MQLGLFEPEVIPRAIPDDAEAVVYMITMSSSLPMRRLFVMRLADAVRFCSDPRTAGRGRGGPWAYAFTTHQRDWRDELDAFRPEDGRFDGLLADLGIEPIYRGGQRLAMERAA